MKTRTCFWSSATAVCWFALAAQIAQGQNIYFIGKNQAFTQSDSSAPVADSYRPFKFAASAPSAATIVLPAGSTVPLTYSSREQIYALDRFFLTKSALDTAWPNGTYRMTGTVAPSTAFNLATDNYPAGIPQVTSGTWSGGLLVVNPGQATTINLNTFTGYATGGIGGAMAVSVSPATTGGNEFAQNEVATQAVFGITASSTPLTTISIPGGLMTSGQVYQGKVEWNTITTLDVPNKAVAIFTKNLRFYIAAQTPGTFTQPPVITSQPTNQSAVAGNSTTFLIGVTVGGSTNTGNLLISWYFNGQDLGYLDDSGGKYASNTNGFGLRINNLTAADAGTYSVRLGNAGGFVTSSSATLTVAAAAAPTISSQPAAKTVSSGSTVVFSVTASGVPTPTYQWRKDGVNISGATNATYFIRGATTASQGSYSVWVTNNLGTAPSSAAALTVTSTNDPGRLINLAILAPIAAGETMTMGTVLGGSGTSGNKPLLVRAAGPALLPFGVGDFLPDPTMTLNYTSPTPTVVMATNNDWEGTSALSNAFVSVGAFPYSSDGSKDAALFRSGASALVSGKYTVEVSGANTGTGTVIAEIYDASGSAYTLTTPRLINVSVLKQINAGTTLTAGFVIGGSTARSVLIRAIGPGLVPFGINDYLPDPTMTLNYTSPTPTVVLATNNDWAGDPAIVSAFGWVGAFPITNTTSKDAMLLITLAPGKYTAEVSPASGTAGGQAIVEVYEVP